MAYEKEKDKCLFEEWKDFGETKVGVGVFKYEGIEPKVQISRQNKSGEDWKFSKLGRLSLKELEEILPLLETAKEKLKE